MASGAPSILIAEDDSVQLKLIDQILQDVGLKTMLARNGYEAIALIEKETPDLFLIDLHMPDMTGFQLLKTIRDIPKFKEIPIIMMSVDTSEESAILCVSSGANSYINKPIRISELYLKIRKLLKFEIEEGHIMELYTLLRSKSIDTNNQVPAEMINYVLGDEAFQEAKAICTFSSLLTIRIHGLLPLVHKLGSNTIQKIYDEIISMVFEVIYKERGAIHSVFNDMIFCSFGIPVVYDNDTINALVCANELKKINLDIFNDIAEIREKPLKMTISIMSGKVYQGAIRTMQALNDSLMGNPLIRAMMNEYVPHEPTDSIIIDCNTMNLVKDYVDLEPLEVASGNIFPAEELFKVLSVDLEKISTIPNINKQYTPKDSVSGEGYEKL